VPSRRDLQRLLLGALALMLTTAALVGSPSAAQAAVSAPTRLAPDGQQSSGTPTLEWKRVPGAASYEVDVSATAEFRSPVLESGSTVNRRFVPTKSLPSSTVYWRVRSVSDAGTRSAWSTASFSISQGAGPNIIGPTGAEEHALPESPPILSWEPISGVSEYQIEVDDAEDFIQPGTVTVSNTSYLIRNPQHSATFYWRVRGVHDGGAVTRWSEVGSYKIPGPQEVDPVTVEPANSPDTVLEDVVFDWDPVPGAKTYDIRVSSDENFNTIIDARTVKSTRYSPPTTYDNNQYWWQVRARDVLENTRPWSDPQIPVRQFQRHWPDTPELMYPADAGTVGHPMYFQWDAVDHASHYELNLSTDPNFSPHDPTKGVYNYHCFTRATTYTPVGIQKECMPAPGLTYYWRVRALDGPFAENDEDGVWGRWSTIREFVYDSGRVQQVSPANMESVAVPTLRWNAAQDAERYVVTVHNSAGAVVATTETFALSWTPPNELPAGTYRWSVVSVDHLDQPSPTPMLSSQRSFVVSGTPEDTPAGPLAPLGPSGGATTLRSPALQWEPYPQAASYRVVVGKVGSTIVANLNDEHGRVENFAYPAATDVEAANLKTGTYRWYVQAYGSDGSLLAEGPEGSYTIANLADVTGQKVALSGLDLDSHFCDRALDAPTGEPNFCQDLKQTPVLKWDPVPGASHYMVYPYNDRALTNDIFPGTLSVTTQNNSWTPRTLMADSQAGQAYYWVVRPCKADGVCSPEPTTATHAFDKRSNQVAPIVDAATTHQADDITLTWQDYLATNRIDDAAHRDATGAPVTVEAQGYRVQISTTRSFSTVLHEATVDQTTYTPFSLTFPEGPLFARVQAVDGSGNHLTWSDPVEITKTSPKPVLLPVSRTSTDSTPVLHWEPTELAASYDVEISNDDPLFASANQVKFENSKHTAYSPADPLAAGTTYYWHVRRLDADGRPGPWSKAGSFEVTGQATNLLSPSNGSYVDPTGSLFTWDSVPGAAQYVFNWRYQGTQAASGQTTTHAQAYAPRSALMQGPWSWRVTTLDTRDQAIASTPWRSFTVDTVGPKVKSKSPTRSPAARNTNFAVTFSEPVRRVSGVTMRLFQDGRRDNLPARVTGSNGGRTWTLNPSRLLRSRARYTLKLSSGITDKAGNTLKATSWRVTAGR